ncbi:hypothetical protein MRX96_016695 [Rhipicephalus microplus]
MKFFYYVQLKTLLSENTPCQVQLEHDYCGPEDESLPEEDDEAVMEVCLEDNVADEQEPVEVYVEQSPEEGAEGVMNEDYQVAAEMTL